MRITIVGLVTALLLACSCDSAPPEPTSAPTKAAPRAAALKWKVPPTWTLTKSAERGKYRAKYEVPPQGDAKHPAELLIYKTDDADADLDDLTKQFEGQGAKSPTIDNKKVGPLGVRLLEIGGTYRFPMGPAMGKQKKRHAAHVLKSDWRALGAAVATPNRGKWVFRLVGPSDTVSAAKSSFHNMINQLE